MFSDGVVIRQFDGEKNRNHCRLITLMACCASYIFTDIAKRNEPLPINLLRFSYALTQILTVFGGIIACLLRH